jgi:hypothetical protein
MAPCLSASGRCASSEELPLCIHFASGSEREAAQVVIVQIAEDRFDDPKVPAVQQSPFTAVDSGFHRDGLRVQVLGLAAVDEGNLPSPSGIRVARSGRAVQPLRYCK